MKKLYTLLVICIFMPLSIFASNTKVVVNNGMETLVAQDMCGDPG